MLILLICLIGVGGAAFTYRGDTEEILDKAWSKAAPPVRTNLERYVSTILLYDIELNSNRVINSLSVVDGRVSMIHMRMPPSPLVAQKSSA